MALQLHRSSNPADLANEFAALLAREPSDVFTPELVVVPARGVERWLTQRLSHVLGASGRGDGVCAGLDILTAHSLVSLVLGRDRDDPWRVEALVWPTLEALDEVMGQPGFAALTRHLGADTRLDPTENEARRRRRYSVARRIAALFDSYLRERPSMLSAWERGEMTDGFVDLDADLAWQPALWRLVSEKVKRLHGLTQTSSARHAQVVDDLRGGPSDALPHRVSFFGHNRIAAGELEIIAALARHHDVHMWLPHPSPALWDALSDLRRPVPRAQDDSDRRAAHPLLATLGRDIRQTQRLLLSHLDEANVETSDTHTDAAQVADSSVRTRLRLLQEDIRANRPGSPEPAISPDDTSIQIHGCHGPARQVEALRELLVWLLDDSNGALQPRDILVMCPDIETFAPHIKATFGLSGATPGQWSDDRHRGQQIRLQLADRSQAVTNPLVDVAQRLIELISSRLTAAEVLDFLSHPAVVRRFGLSQEDLETVARWITESGVRWGLDAHHRDKYGLDGLASNSWDAGLDRLALGVAASRDTEGPLATRLPIDSVGSNTISLAGRVLEFVERLRKAGTTSGALSGEASAEPLRPVSEWTSWLRESVLMLADCAPDQRWQVAQFERDLTRIDESAPASASLRLTDVKVMVEQRWAARPTRANFRTGAVTVCTMVPMRSVPHRAVIVLGADDGTYPRQQVVDGDDALARRAMAGERDPRSEDSQLLLDAVMAASDYFIALYSAFDERSGERRPACVPLQELQSAAERTGSEPRPGEDPPFLRLHPLQAFDERNFMAHAPIPGGSYDSSGRRGALALREYRTSGPAPQSFLEAPLSAWQQTAISLDELVAFYENPAREFLKRRLDVGVLREEEELDVSIPIAPDPLEKWSIGDRLLSDCLVGRSLETAIEALHLSGQLPPGALGEGTVREVANTVRQILADRPNGTPQSVDVTLDFADGRRLRGVVGNVIDGQIVMTTYSTVNPKHIVGAWVRLLAASAAGAPVSAAHLVGKGSNVTLRAPSPEQAYQLIGELMGYYAKGMQFPIGLAPKSASSYAKWFDRASRASDANPIPRALGAAADQWQGTRFEGENADAWWVRIHGAKSTVASLNSMNSLTYWAPRVWTPIHQHGGQ